ALGFTIYADALRFEFFPLDIGRLFSLPIWPKLYQHLGPDYFLYRLEHDVRLEQLLTSFEINWLWQLELSMLMAVAVAQNLTLPEAAETVQADRIAIAERALKVIFQSQQKEDQDDEEQAGRLHKKLLTYVADPLIQQILREHEHVLWDRNDPDLS